MNKSRSVVYLDAPERLELFGCVHELLRRKNEHGTLNRSIFLTSKPFAKERLPKEEYDYIAGGATDEISVDRNHRAYASWALRPRVLRDVSTLDLTTTCFGTKVNLPVLIAPCGAHKRAHPEGEVATYRAAAACGTVSWRSAPIRTLLLKDLAKAARGHSGCNFIRSATKR